METLPPELLKVRRRLRDEFPYYAKHALKIRTKEGDIKPLVLNDAQKILQEAIQKQVADQGFVRLIILKARQQGLSTHVGGFLYSQVSQSTAKRAVVVAHKADSTQALFDLTKRFHDNMPPGLQPATRYSSRRELAFSALDSSYAVATAGGEGIGRGDTFTHAHLSELAFWPKSKAKDEFNALMQAIPNSPGTAVFIESTANGVSGLFYDLWQGAVKGENGFVPVFIPWYITKEYRAEAPESFTRTPEEEKLVEKFGLDNGQLLWRRQRIATNGLDRFKQEYPATPEEAFLTSGRPVFNPEQIVELLAEAERQKPLARMALVGAEGAGFKWEHNPRGELLCYHPHYPGETYYIGADVAMGVNEGNYSVAQVFDSRKRHVARYRALVHPDYFARVLFELGTFYNTARIIVENNNNGILTCTRLGKDWNYPNFFTEVQYDKITDKETVKLGFTTTPKSKPLIIDKLRAAMRENEIETRDEDTLREMLTYIVTETGGMEAEQDHFDDCVMALALVNHIHAGRVEPIVNLPHYFVEMI